MRLMMSKSKPVAPKIIVPSGQLSAGGHTHGRTSQISSTSSWPTMQRRASRSGGYAVRGMVGSAWGAVPGLLQVRFPRPPSEPDVRFSPHPALHEVKPWG